MRTITMGPDALLEYFVEWERWLAGDEIDTSVWTITPDDLTKGLELQTETRATIWLSGPSLGAQYKVKNTITTIGGRRDSRSFILACRER